VVRKRGVALERSSKLEQLERTLRPAALKARQMNIGGDEALDLFRRLLVRED
jgi:hypothetical protein